MIFPEAFEGFFLLGFPATRFQRSFPGLIVKQLRLTEEAGTHSKGCPVCFLHLYIYIYYILLRVLPDAPCQAENGVLK